MSRVVCHLRPSEFFGGPEKQILEQVRRLAGSGWTPIVACFGKPGRRVELIDRARALGIDTFVVETLSNYSPLAVRRLRAELRDRGVDLLVCHGYRADLIGRAASSGSEARTVAVVRGYTAEMLRVRLYEWIDRRLLGGFDRIVAVSEATRDALVSAGVDRRSIDVVHNGVSIPETPPEPAPLAREAGLATDTPLVVAAGRLSPEKGHRYLLEASRELEERGVRHAVAIVGEGRERSQLERSIEKLDLADTVRLLGYRSDPMQCLAAADLVVNPSETEGSPNVVLEAMSIGKAIVATSVGGVPEILRDGHDALLVPAARPVLLADAMQRVLDDADRARSLGDAAHRTAVERHSFDVMSESYVEIYDRVLRGAAGAVATAVGGAAR